MQFCFSWRDDSAAVFNYLKYFSDNLRNKSRNDTTVWFMYGIVIYSFYIFFHVVHYLFEHTPVVELCITVLCNRWLCCWNCMNDSWSVVSHIYSERYHYILLCLLQLHYGLLFLYFLMMYRIKILNLWRRRQVELALLPNLICPFCSLYYARYL